MEEWSLPLNYMFLGYVCECTMITEKNMKEGQNTYKMYYRYFSGCSSCGELQPGSAFHYAGLNADCPESNHSHPVQNFIKDVKCVPSWPPSWLGGRFFSPFVGISHEKPELWREHQSSGSGEICGICLASRLQQDCSPCSIPERGTRRKCMRYSICAVLVHF